MNLRYMQEVVSSNYIDNGKLTTLYKRGWELVTVFPDVFCPGCYRVVYKKRSFLSRLFS